MRENVARRNEQALRWVRGGLFAALSWWALASLALTPAAAIPVASATLGLIALFAPAAAILATVGIMSIPVLAADLVVGVVFLVAGFASVQYLSQRRGDVFLLILSAVLLAWAGPAWAVVALAGLLLGASEGAIVALLACAIVQLAGIAVGEPNVGVIVSGATAEGALVFDRLPESLLTFGWLGPAVSDVSVEPLLAAVSGAERVPVLLLQPLTWAGAAAATGLIRGTGPRRELGPIAVAAGVALAGIAAWVLGALFDSPASPVELLSAGAWSLVIAVGAAVVWEWVFPPLLCATTSPRSSISSEDADVDELLRLIARAEDELSAKHTVEATVMITDMKAFSAMTEEDGSVTSAKAIQRHRDLLMPLIEQTGGSGKSTGGDGLVAAFSESADAARAAVKMQSALLDHNQGHPSERDIVIRIGIATGEVVLDRGGRPFIGSALNLAARIMDLGDGGQVLASKPVATAARHAGIRTHSHGVFELKNIAETVTVEEVLWRQGQEPSAPRCGDRSRE